LRPALSAVIRRVRDPLGLTTCLEDWILDEVEIRADLDHGRD